MAGRPGRADPRDPAEVSPEEVRRIAALARLEVSDEEARRLAGDLTAILGHVGELSSFEHRAVSSADPTGEALRPDEADREAMERDPEVFAPDFRDGFFLVPRLASHEDPEGV